MKDWYVIARKRPGRGGGAGAEFCSKDLPHEGMGTVHDEGIRIAVKRERGGGSNIDRRDSSR
jgi:hypothetical protein